MSSISSVTRGWARRDGLGNIQWGTFTTQTPSGSGWYPTYKAQCACNDDCGKWLFRYDPYHSVYERKFKFEESTTINVELVHGGVPTKFVVKVNSVTVTETPFSGLSGYQSQLTTYLLNRGLPDQIVDTTASRIIPVTVTTGDEVEVIVTAIDPQNASYRFMVPCGELEPVDCVLSDWSNWSGWTDNGDGTESRSRTRTILVPPANGGAACGPLVDNQTRAMTPVDCVLSGWSDWSAWVSDGNGLDTRTRHRIVITAPANGGAPCGPLTETETRPTPTPVDCELTEWSEYSHLNEYDDSIGSICASRTRSILTPPENGGAPCGPLVEKSCVTYTLEDWNMYFFTDAGSVELQDFIVAYPSYNKGVDVSDAEGGNVTINDTDPKYVGFSGDRRMHRLMFKDVSTPIGDPVTVVVEERSSGTTLYTFSYIAGDDVDEVFQFPIGTNNTIDVRFEL